MTVDVKTQKLPSDQVAMEVLAKAQDTHDDTSKLVRELRRQLGTPADLRTVDLDATTPTKVVGGEGKSVGILNATAVPIYLGIGGGAARASSRAVSCPPNSLLVLPVSAVNLEIGVDVADVGAEVAVVQVLLFPTVQAAFLGAVA